MKEIIKGFYEALIVDDRWRLYLKGIRTTISLSLFALMIGVALGAIIAVIKYMHALNEQSVNPNKKPILSILNKVFNFYTTIVRGTPVVLQLIIFYVVSKTAIQAAVITFGLNSAAYVSEIIRAGLVSIDKGQMEAGLSLGLSKKRTIQKIILPQAMKNVLPALFNEFIALVKETAVAGWITIEEITKVSDRLKGATFSSYPLYVAAIIYIGLVYGLTKIQGLIENKLKQSDR